MNFTVVRKNIPIDVSLVKSNEFDVRDEAGKDQSAIDELVAQGFLSQLPILTSDYVLLDGRTGFEAEKVLDGKFGEDGKLVALATVVRVDFVGFAWASLTPEQKQEAITWALQRNLPTYGFSRPATQADVQHVAVQLMGQGADKAKTIKLLVSAGVKISRATKLSQLAESEINARDTRTADTYSKQHDVSPSAAVSALVRQGVIAPARAEKVKEMVKNYGQKGKVNRPQSTSYVRTSQTALTDAIAAVKRYNDANLKKFLDDSHKYTGKFVVDVADIHVRTAAKILAQAERGADRIRTEVNKRVPSTHRF
jgi:hypothetical protein